MYSKNSAGFVVLSDLSNSLRVCHVQWKFSSFRCHVRSFKFQKSCHVKTSNSSSVNIVNDFSNLIHVKILQNIVRLSNCHFVSPVKLNSHLKLSVKYFRISTNFVVTSVSTAIKIVCLVPCQIYKFLKNIFHVLRKFNIVVSCRIHIFLKHLSWTYTCHVRFTNF